MADQVLTNLKFMLADGFPGLPDPRYGPPTDGFTGALSHNVAAAAYPIGTKVQVANVTTGLAGLSTLVYLCLSHQDGTNILAPRHLVAISTTATPYAVTNEIATVLDTPTGQKGPIAVALSAMTTTYYGWFWCGGVAPIDAVPAMEGNFYTLNTVTAGCTMTWGTLATPGLVAGEIGFDIHNAVGEELVGVAFAADA
jgi:hypothetical protein